MGEHVTSADRELCKHALVKHEPALLLLPPHTAPEERGLLPDSFQGGEGVQFSELNQTRFNYVCARPLDLAFFIGHDRLYSLSFQ